MTEQGQFTMADANTSWTEDSNGKNYSHGYTVDPVTGRFESRNPTTKACILCGYVIGPNQVYAIAPGTGIPLFVTLHGAATAPAKLKLSDLSGKFSTGSMSLISPLATAMEGIISFDGKGNFQWTTDYVSMPDILVANARYGGTYAVVNGAFALTVTGDSQPNFYVYMDSPNHGTFISYDVPDTAMVPLMSLDAVTPKSVK
jgi:hypothetical protein